MDRPVNEAIEATVEACRANRSNPCAPRVRGGVASALVLVTGPAQAQEWLKDRMYAEGAGVRTGDVEWHPGAEIEGGYDSNYFIRSDKSQPGINLTNGPCTGRFAPCFPVAGTPEMRITPSLSLSTIGPERKDGERAEPPSVDFRLGASGTYREFFGQLTPEQRNFSADVNARLGIQPGRPVGGSLFAAYDRTIQPNVIGDPDLSFNHDAVTVGENSRCSRGAGRSTFTSGTRSRTPSSRRPPVRRTTTTSTPST